MSEGSPVTTPRETLQLIHHHPGRLRVRAAAFRQGDAADRARRELEAVPGIAQVTHTARTGSLLVEYQPGLADPDVILSRVAEAAGLDMPSEEERAREREPALVAIDVAREINAIVHEVTGYRADLRSIVPLGMAALAGYSLLRHEGTKLPRWDNLLYWSYNIFTQLHRREIDAAARAVEGEERAPAGAASAPRAKP